MSGSIRGEGILDGEHPTLTPLIGRIREDQQGDRVPKLSAPLSTLLALSKYSLPANHLIPSPPVYLLSSPGNAASGCSMPQQLRGQMHMFIHSSGLRCLPRTWATPKKKKKNPNLLHAPLIKRPRELKSGPKRKENAGLIYEAFRCLDGSLHPCSGNAAVQCASRLTVLQHPGALL